MGIGSDLKMDIDSLDIPTICTEVLLWGRKQLNWVGLKTDKVAPVSTRALIVSLLMVISISPKVLVRRKGNALSQS